LIAAHLYPGLSTMELPHYEMGYWAVNYLLEHGAGTTANLVAPHVLECRYVERGSIAERRSHL
jgi:LacI family transcriptional regulator